MSTLRLTAEENLKSEREVVKEERRYRVDNQPIGRAVEEMTALAYEKHPYHWPTARLDEGTSTPSRSPTCRTTTRSITRPTRRPLIVAGPVTHSAGE